MARSLLHFHVSISMEKIALEVLELRCIRTGTEGFNDRVREFCNLMVGITFICIMYSCSQLLKVIVRRSRVVMVVHEVKLLTMWLILLWIDSWNVVATITLPTGSTTLDTTVDSRSSVPCLNPVALTRYVAAWSPSTYSNLTSSYSCNFRKSVCSIMQWSGSNAQ